MPERLVEACEKARREGRDFPTVWWNILRPHPLVIGLPSHETVDGDARILISLRTGQTLVSTRGRYSLR